MRRNEVPAASFGRARLRLTVNLLLRARTIGRAGPSTPITGTVGVPGHVGSTGVPQHANNVRLGSLVGAASAVLGALLAILYTLGAVLTTGALRQAHLSVRDTLLVVPSQQFLARGMSVFLSSFGIVLYLVVSLGFSVWVAIRWDRRRRAFTDLRDDLATSRERLLRVGDHPERQELLDELQQMEERIAVAEPTFPPRLRTLLIGLSLAGLVVSAPFMHLFDLPLWLVLLAILGLAWKGALPLLWLPVVSTLALWLSVLITAFYYPSPLARVTLTTQGGGPVHGVLIAQNANHWYLGSTKGKVLVVPDGVVLRATITPGGRAGYPRRVYRVVESWFR
jgi:hypothetical protein